MAGWAGIPKNLLPLGVPLDHYLLAESSISFCCSFSNC